MEIKRNTLPLALLLALATCEGSKKPVVDGASELTPASAEVELIQEEIKIPEVTLEQIKAAREYLLQMSSFDAARLLTKGDCLIDGTTPIVPYTGEESLANLPEEKKDSQIDALNNLVNFDCPEANVFEEGGAYVVKAPDGRKMEAWAFVNGENPGFEGRYNIVEKAGIETLLVTDVRMNGVDQVAHRLSAECSAKVPGFSDQEVLRWLNHQPDSIYLEYGLTKDSARQVICANGYDPIAKRYVSEESLSLYLGAAILRRAQYQKVLEEMLSK